MLCQLESLGASHRVALYQGIKTRHSQLWYVGRLATCNQVFHLEEWTGWCGVWLCLCDICLVNKVWRKNWIQTRVDFQVKCSHVEQETHWGSFNVDCGSEQHLSLTLKLLQKCDNPNLGKKCDLNLFQASLSSGEKPHSSRDWSPSPTKTINGPESLGTLPWDKGERGSWKHRTTFLKRRQFSSLNGP